MFSTKIYLVSTVDLLIKTFGQLPSKHSLLCQSEIGGPSSNFRMHSFYGDLRPLQILKTVSLSGLILFFTGQKQGDVHSFGSKRNNYGRRKCVFVRRGDNTELHPPAGGRIMGKLASALGRHGGDVSSTLSVRQMIAIFSLG